MWTKLCGKIIKIHTTLWLSTLKTISSFVNGLRWMSHGFIISFFLCFSWCFRTQIVVSCGSSCLIWSSWSQAACWQRLCWGRGPFGQKPRESNMLSHHQRQLKLWCVLEIGHGKISQRLDRRRNTLRNWRRGQFILCCAKNNKRQPTGVSANMPG